MTIVEITQHVIGPVVFRIHVPRPAICSHRLLRLSQRFIGTGQAQLRINTSRLKLLDSPIFLQRLQILTAGFTDLPRREQDSDRVGVSSLRGMHPAFRLLEEWVLFCKLEFLYQGEGHACRGQSRFRIELGSLLELRNSLVEAMGIPI